MKISGLPPHSPEHARDTPKAIENALRTGEIGRQKHSWKPLSGVK